MQNGVRATWFGTPDCDICSSGLCWQTTTTTGASGRSSPRDPAFLLLDSKTRFYTRLTDDLLALSYISWQTEHSIPGYSAHSLLSDAWGPLSGKRETTSSSRWVCALCAQCFTAVSWLFLDSDMGPPWPQQMSQPDHTQSTRQSVWWP